MQFCRLLLVCCLALLAAACANGTTENIFLPGWVESGPSAADVQDAYPGTAYAASVEGLVMLVCTIQENRRLACVIDREAPQGYGFGDAALRLSRMIVAKKIVGQRSALARRLQDRRADPLCSAR